jgi:hypothetical protein
MRTIKRCSIKINLAKKGILLSLAHAFAKEKQHWLLVFQQSSLLKIMLLPLILVIVKS